MGLTNLWPFEFLLEDLWLRSLVFQRKLGTFSFGVGLASSKVQPRTNLAAQLANTQQACALHRLLPKLRMHTRAAETVALTTVPAGKPAFVSSSSSFYIGMLTKHPAQLDLSELEQNAMEELCVSQLCSEELSGEELEENNNLKELDGSALHTEKIELEQIASKMNQDSLSERSLRENVLPKEPSASQPDEGKSAFAASGQESLANQLRGKELVNIFAFPLLHSEQGALEQSASENSSSANSGILPSLIRVFVILTVISLPLFSLSFLSSFSSLTCQSLSFQMSSHSLNCTSLSLQPIFPNGWAS